MSATNRFRANVLGALTALIIQFLLGTGVNLFVTITRRHPGANAGNFFGGVIQTVFWAATHAPVVLILHTILGLFILLNAIGVLVNAVRLRASGTLGPAIIGLIGVLAAGFNGASFLIYNHDINSYLMSVAFAIATAAYVWLLYVLPRGEAAPTRRMGQSVRAGIGTASGKPSLNVER